MSILNQIERLKQKVYAQSNQHCFIERERFLETLHDTDEKSWDYYANILSDMLDIVSTPIDEDDIFVGRVVEAAPDEEDYKPNKLIFAKGHMNPEYKRLLILGYRGILEQVKENAKNIGTETARNYANNAEIVVNAIRRFALRYAEAARKQGKMRAYEALLRVPYEPAYDLYSALQGMWIVHMVASCYMGSRDYAFGYMDEYLYPYYQIEKEQGATDREICEMLAGFFVKTNEVCGRTAHNYNQKPVLSHSSKQYILLDGGLANEFSQVILEASKLNCMAQPQFTVILSQNSSEAFQDKVFETMTVLTDKLHVYNYELVRDFLRKKGLPEEIALRPTFSACCTFDLNYHSFREEFYLPTVQLFCDTLYNQKFDSKEALLKAYGRAVTKECENYLTETRNPEYDWCRCVFLMDSLLLGECNEACEYPPYGMKYRVKNIMLPGVATLGDSLCALDKLVFQGNMSYDAFVEMLKANFVGCEDVLERITTLPKFGNNYEEDSYTIEMAEILSTAVEQAAHDEKEILVPGFYSLDRDNQWASEIPATPDGRLAGEPISENQSPVYGADKKGITSLLNSISKLPFDRTPTGGLNLTFSAAVGPDILKALIKTYFQKSGLHVGITVLDREILKDAMRHPEKYQSLTVRIYGFSEYFVCLPRWQQLAILNRTAY